MRIASKALITGAVILFGTATYASAQAPAPKVRACVGPSGAVRILLAAENCKVNETAMEWNVSGPAGPPGPQGQPGPAGSSGGETGSGLRVSNAAAEDLGPLLDASNVVLTLPTGRKVYAQLFAGGPPANWTVVQYYTTTDCSGEPSIIWPDEDLVMAALVRRGGVWATRAGTVAQRTVRSAQLVGDSGVPGACQTVSPNTFTTAQFDFYSPIALKLIYPLAVQ